MATTHDYAQFVCGQIEGVGFVRYKMMFGECMIYVNEKPILLLCDNTVYIKMLPCLEELCADCETGVPYKGAKEHYILDVEDIEFIKRVVSEAEAVTPLPKKKK